ncbi:hypothetical protein OS965_38600 [Streptomyces sp. H27-G5]|uniref:hypothetical protein n=1 Tax=Streptomyces sp. H27-G5 TaxID=2996698 RepID=UPI00226DF8F4|nr:hypothetical protein [Streptomyces sp. H27-G5]MCY0923974.1 hypothetical protein [Streptomyces sp. H27-G5]
MARAATEAGREIPYGRPDGWGACGYRPGTRLTRRHRQPSLALHRCLAATQRDPLTGLLRRHAHTARGHLTLVRHSDVIVVMVDADHSCRSLTAWATRPETPSSPQ